MITRDQQEYIEKNFRIPVDADCPGSNWIISLARESIMPSDEELKQMQSCQEYIVRHTYAKSYQGVVLRRGLPYDSGHNTVIFKKSERGWLFRRLTWESPFFVPSPTENEHPLTLVEAINRVTIINEKKRRWKREHPEIFPPTSNTTPPAK